MGKRPRGGRRAEQLTLFTRGGGARRRRARVFKKGKRPGRPKKFGARLRHAKRPYLARRHPTHVTWRVLPGLPNLRSRVCMQALRKHLRRGKDRFGFRLVHFSVQHNHIHLLCEAEDARSLARGLQGLAVRIAKGLNRALERKGKVFADRYHNRVLRTPTEVRWALGYVLCNARHHDDERVRPRRWRDPCSSADYFGGFHDRGRLVGCREVTGSCAIVAPRTWLLHRGWLTAANLGLGKLPTDHVPGLPP